MSEQVPSEDHVARFVLFRRWIRANGTVKHDAFLPPPVDLNLSVTRHGADPETQLWERGSAVAARRPGGALHGRADLQVGTVRFGADGLDVVAAPIEDDPQHAHIVGWSLEKPSQMAAAQRLATEARFQAAPVPPTSR